MHHPPTADYSRVEAGGGWCVRCGMLHSLPVEPVINDCLELMAALQRHQRIDGLIPGNATAPQWTTECLFGESGGKMLGMLACRDRIGRRLVLRAFSGQYNGFWQVPGWVGPIFDPMAFAALVAGPDQEIKRLGRMLAGMSPDSPGYSRAKRQRKQLSQQLMGRIHALYQLVNFRGESVALSQAFLGRGVPPAGTGDCCGPKLLHHAALNGLRPEAMAEFYWGRANASGSRHHGCFYPACASKCRPILGFQLCGLS